MSSSKKDPITVAPTSGFNDRDPQFLVQSPVARDITNLRYGLRDGVVARPPIVSDQWISGSWSPLGDPIPPALFGKSDETTSGVLITRPDQPNRLWTDKLVEPVAAINDQTRLQSTVFPTMVETLPGTFPGQVGPLAALAVTTNGVSVLAQATPLQGTITLTFRRVSGELVRQPLVLQCLGPNAFTGNLGVSPVLTAHGTYVVLWYLDDTGLPASNITATRIDVSPSAVSVNYNVVAYSPGGLLGFSTQNFAVTSFEDQSRYAYLVSRSATDTTAVRINRFDTTTGSQINSIEWSGEANNVGGWFSAAALVHPGQPKMVAAAWIETGTVRQPRAAVVDETLQVIMPPLTAYAGDALHGGSVTCAFGVWSTRTLGDPVRLVTGASRVLPDGLQGGLDTVWSVIDVSAGFVRDTFNTPFLRPITHGRQWRISPDDVRPIWPLARVAQRFEDTRDPTSPGYVTDPAVLLHCIGLERPGSEDYRADAVARYGNNTYMNTFVSPLIQPSSATWITGNELHHIYPQLDRSGVFKGNLNALPSSGGTGRVSVTLYDPTSSKMPVTTLSQNGLLKVAAGQPIEWDGVELVETGYPNVPILSCSLGAGVSNVAQSDVRFMAIYTHTDAAGTVHRSPPSLPLKVTISPTGQPTRSRPTIWVTPPGGLKGHATQIAPQLEVYVSQGSSFGYVSTLAITSSVDGAWSAVMEPVFTPFVSTAAIYTDGSATAELASEALPAVWDTSYVSPRSWAINAEDRSVLFYSKLPVARVATEWNSRLTVQMPVSAGPAIAVREVGGIPVVFCENGIYAVDGSGRNNTGTGGTDYQVQLVSNTKLHPQSRNTITRTPWGVFLRTLRGWAMMSNVGEPVEIAGVMSDVGSVQQVAYFNTTNELYVFSDRGILCFHVPTARCTRIVWTGRPNRFIAVAPRAQNGLTLLNTVGFYFMDDVTSEDTTCPWSWKTGWVQPNGALGGVLFKNYYMTGYLSGGIGGASVQMQETFDNGSFVTPGRIFGSTDYRKGLQSADTDLTGLTRIRFDGTNRGYNNAGRHVSVALDVAETTGTNRSGVLPVALTFDWTAEDTSPQKRVAAPGK